METLNNDFTIIKFLFFFLNNKVQKKMETIDSDNVICNFCNKTIDSVEKIFISKLVILIYIFIAQVYYITA